SDPRPLDGLLRGASAFVRVGEFWMGVLRQIGKRPRDPGRQWYGERVVVTALQSVDALDTVRRNGDLTATGRRCLGALQKRAQYLVASARREKQFDRWTSSAAAILECDRRQWLAAYGVRATGETVDRSAR